MRSPLFQCLYVGILEGDLDLVKGTGRILHSSLPQSWLGLSDTQKLRCSLPSQQLFFWTIYLDVWFEHELNYCICYYYHYHHCHYAIDPNFHTPLKLYLPNSTCLDSVTYPKHPQKTITCIKFTKPQMIKLSVNLSLRIIKELTKRHGDGMLWLSLSVSFCADLSSPKHGGWTTPFEK